MSVQRAKLEVVAKAKEVLEPALQEGANPDEAIHKTTVAPRQEDGKTPHAVKTSVLEKSPGEEKVKISRASRIADSIEKPVQETTASEKNLRVEPLRKAARGEHSQAQSLPSESQELPQRRSEHRTKETGSMHIPIGDGPHRNFRDTQDETRKLELLVHELLRRREKAVGGKQDEHQRALRSNGRAAEIESRLRRVEMKLKLNREI
jgi:hypothetical protein